MAVVILCDRVDCSSRGREDTLRGWLAVPFTVGQRVCWIKSYSGIVMREVVDGMVVDTGPAVTQVWDDSSPDQADHHMVTLANDKVWTDREKVVQFVEARNQEAVSLLNDREEKRAAKAADQDSRRHRFWP